MLCIRIASIRENLSYFLNSAHAGAARNLMDENLKSAD